MNEKIKELREYTKESGWDDEQGRAIPSGSWDKAEAFLSVCESEKLPTPWVSPCGDGTIHFTWTKASGDSGVIEMYWDVVLTLEDHMGMWTEIPKNGDPVFVTFTQENADEALGYLVDFLTKTE